MTALCCCSSGFLVVALFAQGGGGGGVVVMLVGGICFPPSVFFILNHRVKINKLPCNQLQRAVCGNCGREAGSG